MSESASIDDDDDVEIDIVGNSSDEEATVVDDRKDDDVIFIAEKKGDDVVVVGEKKDDEVIVLFDARDADKRRDDEFLDGQSPRRVVHIYSSDDEQDVVLVECAHPRSCQGNCVRELDDTSSESGSESDFEDIVIDYQPKLLSDEFLEKLTRTRGEVEFSFKWIRLHGARFPSIEINGEAHIPLPSAQKVFDMKNLMLNIADCLVSKKMPVVLATLHQLQILRDNCSDDDFLGVSSMPMIRRSDLELFLGNVLVESDATTEEHDTWSDEERIVIGHYNFCEYAVDENHNDFDIAMGGVLGYLYPSRVSMRSIRCITCDKPFLPSDFVLHQHFVFDFTNNSTVHWGFNSNQWHRMLDVAGTSRNNVDHKLTYARFVQESLPVIRKNLTDDDADRENVSNEWEEYYMYYDDVTDVAIDEGAVLVEGKEVVCTCDYCDEMIERLKAGLDPLPPVVKGKKRKRSRWEDLARLPTIDKYEPEDVVQMPNGETFCRSCFIFELMRRDAIKKGRRKEKLEYGPLEDEYIEDDVPPVKSAFKPADSVLAKPNDTFVYGRLEAVSREKAVEVLRAEKEKGALNRKLRAELAVSKGTFGKLPPAIQLSLSQMEKGPSIDAMDIPEKMSMLTLKPTELRGKGEDLFQAMPEQELLVQRIEVVEESPVPEKLGEPIQKVKGQLTETVNPSRGNKRKMPREEPKTLIEEYPENYFELAYDHPFAKTAWDLVKEEQHVLKLIPEKLLVPKQKTSKNGAASDVTTVETKVAKDQKPSPSSPLLTTEAEVHQKCSPREDQKKYINQDQQMCFTPMRNTHVHQNATALTPITGNPCNRFSNPCDDQRGWVNATKAPQWGQPPPAHQLPMRLPTSSLQMQQHAGPHLMASPTFACIGPPPGSLIVPSFQPHVPPPNLGCLPCYPMPTTATMPPPVAAAVPPAGLFRSATSPVPPIAPNLGTLLPPLPAWFEGHLDALGAFALQNYICEQTNAVSPTRTSPPVAHNSPSPRRC